MKRKVELFVAGCPVCKPVIDMVTSMTNNTADLTVFNLTQLCDTGECLEKIETYKITSLPAVVVDGTLLSCCSGKGVSREELLRAGLGQA